MGTLLWRTRSLGRCLPALYLFFILIGGGCAGPSLDSSSSQNTDFEKSKHLLLDWPLTYKKISRFFSSVPTRTISHVSYKKKNRRHDGIDIPAPKGTPIYAPAAGQVIYSGKKFNGYGNLVIIEHDHRWATLYGHCHKIFVKAGEKIPRGTLIAQVGKTGHATAPHLHFEVRKETRPVDPLEYLP